MPWVVRPPCWRPAGDRGAGAGCVRGVDAFGVPDRRRVRPRTRPRKRRVDDPGGAAAGRLERHLRRRIYTGKPARLLKSRWTDAWDAPDAPEPLRMPLQNILVSEAHQRMNESDNPDTVAMPVGQIVGREIRPVADIIAELVRGFEEATRRLDDIRES
jgi:hypothetical protein